MPTTNHNTRNTDKLIKLVMRECPPPVVALDVAATVLNKIISKMPKISSRISTENTSCANLLLNHPKSSNALYIIVVEEMLNIPPRKRLSKLLHPKSCPIVAPTPTIAAIVSELATTGRIPILATFLSENSNPNTNIKKMTPISLHTSMLLWSCTEGI